VFSGCLVAMITPFRDGAVDEPALRRLVQFHLKHGTDGLVPCGTTGESVSMTEDEQCRVIEIVVDEVNGKIPVIAGTGTNSTAKTIKLTKHAQEIGADGALLVTPYYNKPTQQGLYLHFEAVARETDLPLVLYNVPGRTSVNLLPETVARLAKIPTIVGIKEASANMDQASQIVSSCRPDFALLSGDDSLTLPLLSLGGVGIISVVGNIAPAPMVELVSSYRSGNVARARELHYAMFDLCRAMFLETNPIPVKTAAAMLGLCGPELRLPLCPLADANRQKLETALRDCAVLQTAPV
jgi:4-hydroxy-tetrahydrodipicolinate synthase